MTLTPTPGEMDLQGGTVCLGTIFYSPTSIAISTSISAIAQIMVTAPWAWMFHIEALGSP
jgi:hypothetical protein